MSQVATIKINYTVDKDKEKELFDFFNQSLNNKEFDPNESFFKKFKESNIAKGFFEDVRYYEIPEKVYTKEYDKDELEELNKDSKKENSVKKLLIEVVNYTVV